MYLRMWFPSYRVCQVRIKSKPKAGMYTNTKTTSQHPTDQAVQLIVAQVQFLKPLEL